MKLWIAVIVLFVSILLVSSVDTCVPNHQTITLDTHIDSVKYVCGFTEESDTTKIFTSGVEYLIIGHDAFRVFQEVHQIIKE